MVFDAHIRAFEFFGGTPIRGIYDNMTTAVTKVLCGSERQWNTNFLRLCAHYRVQPTACTPASGNEKGRVERQVQIDRQQFFTPMPKGETIAELNDVLISRVVNYNNRHKHPEYQDKTLQEVFLEEYPCFVKAPLKFDGCKEIDVRVSTTCLVRFDRNNYSVDCSAAGKVVQCKSYADKLVFIYQGKEIARHERRFTAGQTYYDSYHYFPILARKPGALRNGAPFKDMVLPDELNQVRVHLEKGKSGSRDFAQILSYIPIEGIESVVAACREVIKTGVISKDIIVNILLRNKEAPDSIDNIGIIYLPLKHTLEADCKIYDKLLSGGLV